MNAFVTARRGGLAWLLGLVMVGVPALARADVWGYVDARGVAHLAATRLDERYELFSRGSPVFAMGGASLAAASAPASAQASGETPTVTPEEPPAPAPALPPRLAQFFATSPGYRLAQPLLRDAALSSGIEYELLKTLIVAESGFDPHAVSPKGAIGLMQVMPATARRWGVSGDARVSLEKKLADPQVNVRTGVRYLRHLIELFPDRLDLALAAYNAGEGAVQRAGNRIPPYRETQGYVKTVLHLYALLKPPRPVRSTPASVAPAPTPALAPVAPPRRVRMELPGQVPGRASMPPPLTTPSSNLTD